jgi:hypothetical protein
MIALFPAPSTPALRFHQDCQPARLRGKSFFSPFMPSDAGRSGSPHPARHLNEGLRITTAAICRSRQSLDALAQLFPVQILTLREPMPVQGVTTLAYPIDESFMQCASTKSKNEGALQATVPPPAIAFPAWLSRWLESGRRPPLPGAFGLIRWKRLWAYGIQTRGLVAAKPAAIKHASGEHQQNTLSRVALWIDFPFSQTRSSALKTLGANWRDSSRPNRLSVAAFHIRCLRNTLLSTSI